MSVSIIIDGYRCSACMTCVELCPDIFQLNELTGKAEAIDSCDEITDCLQQAAAFCPEKCIEIE